MGIEQDRVDALLLTEPRLFPPEKRRLGKVTGNSLIETCPPAGVRAIACPSRYLASRHPRRGRTACRSPSRSRRPLRRSACRHDRAEDFLAGHAGASGGSRDGRSHEVPSFSSAESVRPPPAELRSCSIPSSIAWTTFAACSRETRGPICTSSFRAPSRSFSVCSLSFARNEGAIDSCTNSFDPAQHIWPAFWNAPHRAPSQPGRSSRPGGRSADSCRKFERRGHDSIRDDVEQLFPRVCRAVNVTESTSGCARGRRRSPGQGPSRRSRSRMESPPQSRAPELEGRERGEVAASGRPNCRRRARGHSSGRESSDSSRERCGPSRRAARARCNQTGRRDRDRVALNLSATPA